MKAQTPADSGALVVSAVAVTETAVPALVAASVARVATVAVQTGLVLLVVTAGIGTGALVAQGGSATLAVEGVLIVGIAGLGIARIDRAVRVLRRRGAIIALVAGFCGLGALEPDLQPAYSSVLIALVFLSAVVNSASNVLVCVLVAEGGFAVDAALEGHALQNLHGSVSAQSTGEFAILVLSAAIPLAAISILRTTLARAPAGLAQARAGSSDSLTPALAAAVRGNPIGVLPRGDPVAITAKLSAAERTVIALLAEGRAPKQIARELGVALTTVRSHIAAGKRETGARTLEQLVGLFVESQREQ